MKKPMNENGKISDQYILFLIDEDGKKVHIEVSANKEPEAVLRKHWRGDDPDTKEVFSKDNPKAKPVMQVWYAGNLTRRKSKAFLMEWELLFTAAGYEIVGSKISYSFRQNPPALSGIEKFAFRKASVSGLLNGDIGRTIKCDEEGGGRRSPFQKFTAEPTDIILRVRVKTETANTFRSFCEREGLTHGQGLELLLAEYTGNNDAVIRDLQERLLKADRCIEENNQKNFRLQETINQLEEDRNYPKKYRTAELQKLLLEDFFNHLPPMKQPLGKMLKRYNYREGVKAFPQARVYSFPLEEGNIHMYVEHIRISKGDPHCVFIYGKDYEGNKIKIRWYSVKGNKFGVRLSSSPFLWEHSPWIFSVQKEGEAMEMVGSLPNLGEIWETWNVPKEDIAKETAGYVETKEDDDSLRALVGEELYKEFRGWIRESEELDQMYESVEHGEGEITLLEENEREVLLDKNSTLDEKIRAARKEK